MNSTAKPKKLHIAFFPWLAFGHIIPFLNLAKFMAQKGHKISFISTTRNIKRLPKIPPHLVPLINLVSLTLPYELMLPHNAEATMDVPYHIIPYLKRAFDGLQEPLTQFLEVSSPDWIVYDFSPYWLPPIASKLGISRAFFSIFNACCLSFFGPSIGGGENHDPRTKPEHFTVSPKWVPFPSNVSFRLHEAKQIFESGVVENVSGVSDSSRFMSAVLGCDVFLIRSCMEIEGDWINLLHDLNQKPVVPVGLLPPPPQVSEDGEDGDTWQNILKWLNNQKKGSVVYIALGSEVTPSPKDFTELALGLELSGMPFFWALRKRHDSVVLPEGFEERTKGRGLVWTRWAPQLRILAHESIGGFLTHCGWSSIIEGLYYGHALIMLPFLGDQGLNARAFEEKKVGVEIERDEEDGSFTRELVAKALRMVVLDEEGRIYREKAKEMSSLIGDKEQQCQYLDKFVDCLQASWK